MSDRLFGIQKIAAFGGGVKCNSQNPKRGGGGSLGTTDPTQTGRSSNALIGSAADYPQNGANPKPDVPSDAANANSARAQRKSRTVRESFLMSRLLEDWIDLLSGFERRAQ